MSLCKSVQLVHPVLCGEGIASCARALRTLTKTSSPPLSPRKKISRLALASQPPHLSSIDIATVRRFFTIAIVGYSYNHPSTTATTSSTQRYRSALNIHQTFYSRPSRHNIFIPPFGTLSKPTNNSLLPLNPPCRNSVIWAQRRLAVLRASRKLDPSRISPLSLP